MTTEIEVNGRSQMVLLFACLPKRKIHLMIPSSLRFMLTAHLLTVLIAEGMQRNLMALRAYFLRSLLVRMGSVGFGPTITCAQGKYVDQATPRPLGSFNANRDQFSEF